MDKINDFIKYKALPVVMLFAIATIIYDVSSNTSDITEPEPIELDSIEVMRLIVDNKPIDNVNTFQNN